MAIIIPSFALEAIRGTAGNVCFSDGLGGPYAKSLPSGEMFPTPNMERVQAVFKSISSAFPLLTTAQKEAWEHYAKTHKYTNSLGEKVTGNANAAYVSLNSNRALLTDAAYVAMDSPPSSSSVQPLTAIMTHEISAAAHSLTFTVSPTLPVSATTYFSARLSDPLPGGAVSLNQFTRLIEDKIVIAGAPSDTLAFEIFPADTAYTLQAGDRVIAQVQACNLTNGHVSRRLSVEIVVVA